MDREEINKLEILLNDLANGKSASHAEFGSWYTKVLKKRYQASNCSSCLRTKANELRNAVAQWHIENPLRVEIIDELLLDLNKEKHPAGCECSECLIGMTYPTGNGKKKSKKDVKQKE